MLSAAYDGETVDMQPTFNYIRYRWQKEMKADYASFRSTPLDIIMSDLEYISLERQVRSSKAKQTHA